MEVTFPPTFLWGTATAAHQVEGGNVYNDNWVLEHVPDNPYVESSGDACDHYHLYRKDIGLFAGLGFTLYRFSLEWSRIEPEEGEFSLAQLDHYRRMLATCHEHGITYSRQRFGSDGPLGPEAGVERTQGGDEFWPEALEATIRHASAVTGRPVFVTENGVATIDDTRRIAYVERALRGVAACLRDGIDVRGYTYWSALDSFEWISGYRLNMGLIAVDRQTQARTVKPSAGWLGRVAQAHGF